jgi:hypothetical protein
VRHTVNWSGEQEDESLAGRRAVDGGDEVEQEHDEFEEMSEEVKNDMVELVVVQYVCS